MWVIYSEQGPLRHCQVGTYLDWLKRMTDNEVDFTDLHVGIEVRKYPVVSYHNTEAEALRMINLTKESSDV